MPLTSDTNLDTLVADHDLTIGTWNPVHIAHDAKASATSLLVMLANLGIAHLTLEYRTVVLKSTFGLTSVVLLLDLVQSCDDLSSDVLRKLMDHVVLHDVDATLEPPSNFFINLSTRHPRIRWSCRRQPHGPRTFATWNISLL